MSSDCLWASREEHKWAAPYHEIAIQPYSHTLTELAIDMHALTMSALVTMVHFAPLGLTAPVSNPVLASRTDYCANAPHTVAGT